MTSQCDGAWEAVYTWDPQNRLGCKLGGLTALPKLAAQSVSGADIADLAPLAKLIALQSIEDLVRHGFDDRATTVTSPLVMAVPCHDHPRLACPQRKTWVAGTNPAMTRNIGAAYAGYGGGGAGWLGDHLAMRARMPARISEM
jgi:hypothetical protein